MSKISSTSTNNYAGPGRVALIVGIVAAVVAVAGYFLSGPGAFFQAYLYAFLFWLGISLGLFALQLLHYVVSSRWGLTIRRIAEAASGNIWFMAILFIPLLIGLPFLYEWVRPAEVAKSAILQAKTFYLNTPFFIVRAVIYFAIWILLSMVANRRSAKLMSAPEGNLTIQGKLQGLGAAGLILYGFTMTFASVDWIMSLEPEWNSSAFGIITVLAQVMSGLAFALLMLNLIPHLSIGRDWNFKTTPVPYRDLGALALTMVMAWAYVSYFQMLIIWAGNIPREVVWYISRTAGAWNLIAILIVILQFALPFLILLTIRVRHNLRILAAIGAMLLVSNLIYEFWLVKPAFSPTGFSISLSDLAMPFAIGGLWLAMFFRNLSRRPVLSAADERVIIPASEREHAVS